MYYILKKDIKSFSKLINALEKRSLVRSEYSYNGHDTFGIATHFNKTEANEFIILSERMSCNDPRISWITSRKQCASEEEFLAKIDEKIAQQIENHKMHEINVHTNIYPNSGWCIGASEECQIALNKLGIKYVDIKTPRGSHTGDFYLFNEDKELFEKEILGNCIIGTYRKFFFGRHTIGDEIIDGSYYVSFRPKR